MDINFSKSENIGIIKITGSLEAENADTLKEKFTEHINEIDHFIFDLSELEFLDSTGLGGIISCYKEAKIKNKELVIANLSPKSKMVFEITRAFKVFDVFENIESAKNSLIKS